MWEIQGSQMTSQLGACALCAGLARLYARIRMHMPTRPDNHMHARTHARTRKRANMDQYVILLYHSNNGFAKARQCYIIQGSSNMTGTNCDLFTHKQSRSYLNHLYIHTRWFKYDRDKLWLVYTQIVPVIFEPPCTYITWFAPLSTGCWHVTLKHTATSCQIRSYIHCRVRIYLNLAFDAGSSNKPKSADMLLLILALKVVTARIKLVIHPQESNESLFTIRNITKHIYIYSHRGTLLRCGYTACASKLSCLNTVNTCKVLSTLWRCMPLH